MSDKEIECEKYRAGERGREGVRDTEIDRKERELVKNIKTQ